jgi:hypothetical protein
MVLFNCICFCLEVIRYVKILLNARINNYKNTDDVNFYW